MAQDRTPGQLITCLTIRGYIFFTLFVVKIPVYLIFPLFLTYLISSHHYLWLILHHLHDGVHLFTPYFKTLFPLFCFLTCLQGWHSFSLSLPPSSRFM